MQKREEPRPDIWMPLHLKVFMHDTWHLSPTELGAYLSLVMQAWTRDGLLPSDDDQLRRLARMTRREWARSRNNIIAFFMFTSNGFRHPHLEAELAIANSNLKKCSLAGIASGKSRRSQRDTANDERTDVQRPLNVRSTSVATDVPTDVQPAFEHPCERTLNPVPKPIESKKEIEEERACITSNLDADGKTAPPPAPGLMDRPGAVVRLKAIPAEQAVAAWNAMAVTEGLSQVTTISDQRRRLIAARLGDCGGLEAWAAVLAQIKASEFLLGREGERSWRVGLDWLLKASNFTKVREGNYANRLGSGRVKAGPRDWMFDEYQAKHQPELDAFDGQTLDGLAEERRQ